MVNVEICQYTELFESNRFTLGKWSCNGKLLYGGMGDCLSTFNVSRDRTL